MKQQQKTFNPWTNFERAYQIALLGGFKICPVSAEPIHEDFNRAVESCNLLNIFTPEFSGSLIVELVRPQIEPLGSFPEITVNWKYAVNARANELPTEHYSSAHEPLMKAAQDKGGLSLCDIQDAYKIAATIAQLDNSPVIRLEHVAEAIHYKIIEKDIFYYVLSEPDHVFINGAKIPLFCLSPENKPGFIAAIQNHK